MKAKGADSAPVWKEKSDQRLRRLSALAAIATLDLPVAGVNYVLAGGWLSQAEFTLTEKAIRKETRGCVDFHWKTSTDQLILILSNCLRLHQQSNLCASPESQLNVPGTSIRQSSYGASGRVCTKSLGLWLILLVPGVLHAQHALETSAQQKFISGGTIRLHLEAGGYTITPADSENIVVTCCRAHTEEQLKRVKVEIKPTAASADVYVSETPHNNFQATIKVPRHSNLWVRLSAGELDVEDLEGDKNLEVLAGRIQIDIPHPELYGHCDALVTTGSIKSSAFDVFKASLFRSFEQQGPGKCRLQAHGMTGEIDLRGRD